MITVPIEDQLNGIEGLAELRSKSVAQLSSIRLIFEPGADELKARQLVQERMSQIARTADLGEPSVHDAGAVGHQPHPEDRPDLGCSQPNRFVEIAYWKIRAPASGARSGPSRYLG